MESCYTNRKTKLRKSNFRDFVTKLHPDFTEIVNDDLSVTLNQMAISDSIELAR